MKIFLQDYIILLLFCLFIISLYYFSFLLPNLILPEFEILLPVIILSISLHMSRKDRKLIEFGLSFDKSLVINSISTLLIILLAILIFIIFNFIFWDFFLVSNNLNQITLITFFYILNLSIIEELVFRGLILQIMIDKIGIFLASVISSILFSVAHSFNPGLNFVAIINIFLAGILLSMMYVKSKSIFPQIIFHFLWNFSLAYIIGSKVSGYNIGYITIDSNKNHNFLIDLLFGGNFGLEGGLLTTIILIISIIIVVTKFTESPYINSLEYRRLYKY